MDICILMSSSSFKITVLLDAESKALVDKQARNYNLSDQVRKWIKQFLGSGEALHDQAAE